MHRPPARRPRHVTGALIAALAGAACVDDGPAARPEVHVVAVAAQPCDRPLPAEGVGVVIGDGLVVTAAHVVDGLRWDVRVDGAPATVAAVDARTDLAVLATDLPGLAELTDVTPGPARLLTPDGALPVDVLRTGPLIVRDTTDGASYEREVHTLRPAVADGTSGAPLVDGAGRVAGVVVLANRTDGTSYAVTSAEIAAVLAARGDRPASRGCPG